MYNTEDTMFPRSPRVSPVQGGDDTVVDATRRTRILGRAKVVPVFFFKYFELPPQVRSPISDLRATTVFLSRRGTIGVEHTGIEKREEITQRAQRG